MIHCAKESTANQTEKSVKRRRPRATSCGQKETMKIREIKELLHCRVLCGEEMLDRDVHSACGSDMMSDVLAFVKDQAVLITGLVNPQVIRTAQMMDICCIVFVRGKKPSQDVIDLARETGIVLLFSSERMYSACGILYQAGLQAGSVAGDLPNTGEAMGENT